MSRQIHVALIGDYNPAVLAHQAIPRALELAGQRSGLDVTGCWIDTDRMAEAPSSLLEAFVFARREVARLYERERHLLTEHAILDDDGDGRGSDEPAATAGDGQLARAFVLGARTVARGGDAGRAGAAASGNPRAAALVAERDSLERDVAVLRAAKATMAAATYEAELERLLVAIAEKTQAIRALEGAPRTDSSATSRPPGSTELSMLRRGRITGGRT